MHKPLPRALTHGKKRLWINRHPILSHGLDFAAQEVAVTLEALLGDALLDGEIARPAHLISAMRHGVLNGGKRLRPFLVIETAALAGRARRMLPCALRRHLSAFTATRLFTTTCRRWMMTICRRGQPTVHVAFDEATAILAGDALLTLAFDMISSPETALPAEVRLLLVNQLARAAGVGGMVGGQALDLDAERVVSPDEAGIVRLQAMKTGALAALCLCRGGDGGRCG
jgi:farnesyl diphosphate synthase